VIHGGFRAMGTTVEAWSRDQESFAATVSFFEEAEQAMSRFRLDSDLSVVNGHPGCRVKLSPLLFSVLSSAEDLARRTGGLVDPGLGASLIDWGYDRTFEQVEDRDRAPQGLSSFDWSLDGEYLVRSPGTLIDLGGIGKGWAADRAVEMGVAVVVSAGGDIRSVDPATEVPVLDPWGEESIRVALGVGALATSSTTRRRWRVGGAEAHHLIDPRTMAPAVTPILSASVIAETAAEAEAGAKAVLILGRDGLAWADEQDWIQGAVAVWHDGSVFATPRIRRAA
jgi:thiamine biosynthesis lipoprotein